MRKKKGIFGKIIIGVVVLAVIGAVFGNNDKPAKEEPQAPVRQEQTIVQDNTPAKQTETKQETPKQTTESVQEKEPEKTDSKSSGIRPELKAFLDSYEAFMDEYCEFMESYNASDMTMLMKYSELLSKYTDFADKADKWQSEDMNNEELIYYTEVMNRVSVKLLKVSQSL